MDSMIANLALRLLAQIACYKISSLSYIEAVKLILLLLSLWCL